MPHLIDSLHHRLVYYLLNRIFAKYRRNPMFVIYSRDGRFGAKGAGSVVIFVFNLRHCESDETCLFSFLNSVLFVRYSTFSDYNSNKDSFVFNCIAVCFRIVNILCSLCEYSIMYHTISTNTAIL